MIHIGIPQPARLDGMPRRVRIDRCSDRSFWYADRIGQIVVVERNDGYGYWAREGGIYNCINVIKHEDATLLPLEN